MRRRRAGSSPRPRETHSNSQSPPTQIFELSHEPQVPPQPFGPHWALPHFGSHGGPLGVPGDVLPPASLAFGGVVLSGSPESVPASDGVVWAAAEHPRASGKTATAKRENPS